jgi:hypothetical protein
MRISLQKLHGLCAARGISLGQLLREAGVSRNAFYSMARKRDLMPRSVRAVADQLGVGVAEFVEDDPRAAKAIELLARVDRVVARHPGIDRDNVRHTLLLLEKKPIERLRRALTRGRTAYIRS